MRSLLPIFIAISPALAAAPDEAERFTHLAGVSLADTPSFEHLAKDFGAATVKHTGDAATSDSRVCYRAADGKTIVEFSRGEVDWGFVVRLPRKSDSDCPKTAALPASKLVVAGVSLHMTRDAYMKITGRPAGETQETMQHEFQYVHVLKNGERWDVVISLAATFTHNHLSRFAVTRAETN